MKHTRMLVVSFRGVNFFGKFWLARVSREKLRYSISTIIIIFTALLIFIGLEYLLGLFSAPVADAIFFLVFFLFYCCPCNKFNKVKVAYSFRVAHEEMVFCL